MVFFATCQLIRQVTRLLFDFNIPALRYQPFTHVVPKEFRREMDKLDKATSMFAAMRKSDVLVHHPFHAFSPIINLLWQAASDPKVLAIKQTLYRSLYHRSGGFLARPPEP